MISPFKVHSISNKKLCSLKPNTMSPFWSYTWTQRKQKLRVRKPSLPVQPTNNHQVPSLTDKQILIEKRIRNYAITSLPNEIIYHKHPNLVRIKNNYFQGCIYGNFYIILWYNFIQSAIQTKKWCHERKTEPPRWGVQKNQ